MDTIRSELSRLEAMISTSTQPRNAHMEIPSSDALLRDPLGSSPQACLSREDATPTDPQSHRTSVDTITHAKIDQPPHVPGDMLPGLQVSERDLNDSSAISKVTKYESSFLYASFSTSISSPALHHLPNSKSPKLDTTSIHNLLQKSLSDMHPPCVVDYISLHNLLTLCSNHMTLLDHSSSLYAEPNTDMNLQNDPAKAYTQSKSLLQGHIQDLQQAVKTARQQCIKAGYSLSKIDQVLSPVKMIPRKPSLRLQSNDNDNEDCIDSSETMLSTRVS